MTAFQQAGVENSNFFEKRFDFFIPPGKRLVIEKLSAALSMPHKGVFGPPVIQNTQLVTTVNGILVTHEFAKPIFQSSTGVPSQLTDHFLYLLSPNLYADGGLCLSL